MQCNARNVTGITSKVLMICSEILCESVNLGGKCWLNKCNECMNGRKLEKSFLGDKNVSWNEWRKNEKSGKLEICVLTKEKRMS